LRRAIAAAGSCLRVENKWALLKLNVKTQSAPTIHRMRFPKKSLAHFSGVASQTIIELSIGRR